MIEATKAMLVGGRGVLSGIANRAVRKIHALGGENATEYEGRVILHGLVLGGMQKVKTIYETLKDEDGNDKLDDRGVPIRVEKTIDVSDKEAAPPTLAVTFKHRYDGVAVLRFEGDCPARDALHDSEVGDVWKITLSRIRKVEPKEKNVVDYRDSSLMGAFGGKRPGEERRHP